MDDAQKNTDVLIAGAGPTGLVMAAELARRGIPCRIIDTERIPIDKSRAITIQARTLELFESMGIVGQFVTAGHRTRGGSVYDGGKRIVHISFDELKSHYPYILLIPQAETEYILLTHLESLGVKVERETRLLDFTQDNNGVRARIQKPDGEEDTLAVKWLIGCDGAHSTVRHTLNLPFAGEQYEEGFQLADVQIDWELPDTELQIMLHKGWILAVFPLPGKQYRIIMDTEPEKAPTDHTPTLEEIQAAFNERSHIKATLSNPAWMANYRIHRRMVSRLRDGRVSLAGDSAHIHSPAGGQGMNTGIQDAYNLAWKLALVIKNQSPASLLDTYQEERHPVEKHVLQGSDFLLKMVSVRNPVVRTLRNALLPFLSSLDVMQQLIRNNIAELAVEYGHSSITEDHHLHGGLKAGERAIDAHASIYPGLQPTHLYSLLKKGKYVMLLMSGSQAHEKIYNQLTEALETARSIAGNNISFCQVSTGMEIFHDIVHVDCILLDTETQLHVLYGDNKPAVYLIRPDGYIAFRAPAAEAAEKLKSYLPKIFI